MKHEGTPEEATLRFIKHGKDSLKKFRDDKEATQQMRTKWLNDAVYSFTEGEKKGVKQHLYDCVKGRIRANFALKNYGKVKEDALEMIKQYPDKEEMYVFWAQSRGLVENWEECIAACKATLKVFPENK